jgi:hypothetical protein
MQADKGGAVNPMMIVGEGGGRSPSSGSLISDVQSISMVCGLSPWYLQPAGVAGSVGALRRACREVGQPTHPTLQLFGEHPCVAICCQRPGGVLMREEGSKD